MAVVIECYLRPKITRRPRGAPISRAMRGFPPNIPTRNPRSPPPATRNPRSPPPRNACIPRNVPERDPRGITHVYCPARVTLVPRVYCPARVKSRIFENRVIFADVTSLRIIPHA